MNNYKFEKITINDFDSLYEVMENSFPSIERRKYEEQKDLFYKDIYNVIGYKDNHDKVCAFLAFWKFKDFNFIEHFAVDDSLRGKGIGTKLLKKYLDNNNNLTVLEVELPEDEISTRRIKYYERMGMELNEYDYLQPPLQKGKPLLPLKIMSYGKKMKYHEFSGLRDGLYKNVYKYSM